MSALIVVDMQRDFMPGGALPVPNADTILPLVNQCIDLFPEVVASKDWHPKDHISFAENHPGKKIGEEIALGEISQILWPKHCVQGTLGAEYVEGLHHRKITAVFYKGTDSDIDSYSAFFDNARKRSTGLASYLESRGIKTLYFVGVALDYCVLYSVLDAVDLGFKVVVISDACKAINLHPQDEQHALEAMACKGVNLSSLREVSQLLL